VSLSAETKASASVSVDRLVAAAKMKELPPMKAIAFALLVDALNGALGALREFAPRQAIADYVQAWASIADAQDAEDARKRS
jgi:hypothetical protein